MFEARAAGVDQVLDTRGIAHGYRGAKQADTNAVLGREVDFAFGEEGVDDSLEEGKENHHRDGVQVVHDVVGEAVELGLAGLGDEVVEHLVADEPLSGFSDYFLLVVGVCVGVTYQYMGKKRKTLQALRARLSSSTKVSLQGVW